MVVGVRDSGREGDRKRVCKRLSGREFTHNKGQTLREWELRVCAWERERERLRDQSNVINLYMWVSVTALGDRESERECVHAWVRACVSAQK